jgi:hypothetical protein
MEWSRLFPMEREPDIAQISAYIQNLLWDDLCNYLEQTFSVQPRVEYSRCCAAPGWNVKYRKSGRSLCTLYPGPAQGSFTCLVSIGASEATEAWLVLAMGTQAVRTQFQQGNPLNDARWMMVEVTSPEILTDVKNLIALCVQVHKGKQKESTIRSAGTA